MPTFIKICGITRLADARSAVRSGANALGFVFAPSPRRISPSKAGAIARRVHPAVRKFGVFVDAGLEKILEVIEEARLDAVQLHGAEAPEFVLRLRKARAGLFIAKAIRALSEESIEDVNSFEADAILFDRKDVLDPVNSVRPIPLSWLKHSKVKRFVVAGGLDPHNVGRLVEEVNPWGVDVSGGVEVSPGIKDPGKIKEFVRAVRSAEAAGISGGG